MAPIRGRAPELKMIRALTDAAAHSHGGVLVVEGPPGIGKSRLLSEVMALTEQAGVRPLFAEGFEYQQTVPFAPLFTATLRADPPVGDAEALRRFGSHADLRYWVVHDLLAAISAAASQQPLAIILDDIQWADNATLLAIRSLSVNLATSPVLWVLAARTGAGGPAVREALTLLERDGASFLRLTGVTQSAAAEIIQDSVNANADASLLAMAEKAHGNPFLLMELVRGLGEEDRIRIGGGHAVATGDRLPQRLTATMQQRLDRLSEDARRVVRVAAVMPDRFSAGLLASMLQSRPATLVSAVEEAVRADLLVEDAEQLKFRHDLLREATRQSLPGSLRRAMEREAASTLLDAGAPPEEVATLLARSAEIGDRAAIAALRLAAESVGRSDPGAGADLSQRALELMPRHDPTRGPLVAETVVLLNLATRYEEAQQLAGTTLSRGLSADQEAEVRLSLSMIARGTTQRRIEENRRALQLTPISDITRARHHGWLAYNLMMHGQAELARAAVPEASTAAATTGDPETRILAGVVLACIDCVDGYGRRAVQRLEEPAAAARTVNATVVHQLAAVHRANLLAVVGRLEEATAAVAAGMQVAQLDRDELTLTVWTHIDGLVHLAAGRLSAARATAQSLPPPEQIRVTSVAGWLGMLTLAEVAAHTGDESLLRMTLAEARDAHATGSPAIRRVAQAVLAHAAWRRDDVDQAVRWLAGDTALFETPMWPVDLDHLILAARVAATAGDAGLRARVLRAVEVLERERPHVPLFGSVAQHARGIIERDGEALLAAATALSSSARPLLLAAAAEDAGGELARRQHRVEGLDQLNAAFNAYMTCGAIADAHRVGRALRSFGVSRRIVNRQRAKSGWDSLTGSELKVVHLVGNGATNRTAAEQLHLSPHTVNTHLRNAFAKLGINSRVELTQLLHGSS